MVEYRRRVATIVISRFGCMVGVLFLIGVALTHASPAAGLRSWDLSINENLAASRSQRFQSAARFISQVGDTLPIIAFAMLVAIGLALVHRWRAMAFIPLALLIEVSTFGAVNYLVRRPRPDVATIGSVPSTFSFPSGHVAATLVCWFGLALLLRTRAPRWATAVVAGVGIVAVSAMAWARIYMGMHHFLDVVFGIAMGVGALYIATAAFRAAADSHTRRRDVFPGRVDDDRDDGHRQHRPGETEQRAPGHDAQQHDDRVQAERAAIDHRR